MIEETPEPEEEESIEGGDLTPVDSTGIWSLTGMLADLKKDMKPEAEEGESESDSDLSDDETNEKDLKALHGNILNIIENFNNFKDPSLKKKKKQAKTTVRTPSQTSGPPVIKKQKRVVNSQLNYMSTTSCSVHRVKAIKQNRLKKLKEESRNYGPARPEETRSWEWKKKIRVGGGVK